MKLKLCLVGDPAVGKTSLIHRYVFNAFSDTYRSTLGSKMHLLSFSKYVASDEIVEVQIALFDLMGQHATRDAFRDAMFYGTHGFLAVADLSRPETVYEVGPWVEGVRSAAGDVPCAILLNKADLAGTIGPRETTWLLRTYRHVPYALTSAKTGEGVAPAFEALTERVVQGILGKARARRQMNLLGERILVHARRRGAIGVTKSELLAALRGTDYESVMAAVDALARLGYVVREDIGPGNFRVVLTPKGEAAAGSVARTEFIVEQPT